LSKAIRMARVSARGGFNLFWGLAASTIISAIGVIIVARLLSPSEYGIVTIAVIGPNFISIFQDWGISTAMIKYTAQFRSENKPVHVRNILVSGLVFELVSGFALSLVSFLLADFLATDVFQRPDMLPLIQIASFTIFAGALLSTAQSVFTGNEKMEFNSITLIIQSCLGTVLMASFILLGLGAFGAILGTTIAVLIAGFVSIFILLRLYKRPQGATNDGLKVTETIRRMFKFGLPLSLSAIISGFLAQFYNFLIAIYATNLMIGNYSVATNFAVLIALFASPISTMLFPAFSKLNSQGERETLRSVFHFSVKYAALLVVPAAVALMALAEPAVFILFGEEYTEAPLFLALIAISYLYSAFGSLSLGNLINGQGQTRVNLVLTLVTSMIGFPLSLILIPRLGITGLIITTLTAGIPSLILGIYWVRMHFGATLDLISAAKILLASAAAGAITFSVLSQLNFSSWIELIIGGIIFVFSYIIILLLVRTVDQSDINNLREMLSEFGPLSLVVNFLLSIIEKMISIFQF
jgi:O-antigen/teichoic acid export membrane protein